jgi:hypothetical protein
MGRELFSPQELEQQRAHGVTKQQTELELKQAQDEARKTKPIAPKVKPGEAETLARQVVGGRPDEKVYAKLDEMARGGDAKGLSKALSAMTDETRGNYKGTFIRGLGEKNGSFNLSEFVKNWQAYPRQSKLAIFMDSPEGMQHLRDIDNFHTIAREYADTVAKYGNPSKTGQETIWHKLFSYALKPAAGIIALKTLPGTAIGAAIGGLGLYKFSKILAAPQGARELTNWARLAEAYNQRPDVRKLRALSDMTRSLQNRKD